MLGLRGLPARQSHICKATAQQGSKAVVAKPLQAQTAQHQVQPSAGLLAATAAALLVVAPSAQAAEGGAPAAAAAPAQDSAFDAAVDSLVNAVQATGSVIKTVDDAAISAYNVLNQGYTAAAPVVSQAVKTASPVLEQAWTVTSSTAGPALKSLLPSFQNAGKALEAQLPSGLTDTTTKTASEALSSASPLLAKFAQFVSSSEPLTLAEYALALVALTYLAPVLVNSARGYSDDLPAAAALNTLVNDGDVVLVDIRTAKEKETSGIPDLPSSASSKSIEVEFAMTEDKRLRQQLRNVAGVESQITALQIASLRRINRSTKVLLLDKNGSVARSVAKDLAKKGYGSVYVIDGGFDGRGGWIQSKLQIKPSASFSSLPTPRRLGSLSTRGGNTRSSRALPPPKA